jgi:hypothetical protein
MTACDGTLEDIFKASTNWHTCLQGAQRGEYLFEMLQSNFSLPIDGSNTQMGGAFAFCAEGQQPLELLDMSVMVVVEPWMADARRGPTALALVVGTCKNVGLQLCEFLCGQ